MDSFYPSYDLPGRISHTKLDTGIGGMPPARIGRMEDPSTPSFSSVLNGFVDKFNTELNAPDALLKDVMSGSHNTDIHDVMIAMSKAEININVMTSIVGKVIQAYDKIMQIQV
jgi:flagellar hook-basal body complex protein FliE